MARRNSGASTDLCAGASFQYDSVKYKNILHSSESKSEKSKLAVFKTRSQHTGVSTRF
jgi:hypothetical protein